MVKLTVSSIVAALPLLTPAERVIVIQAAGALDGDETQPTAPAGPANDLWQALCAELTACGLRQHLSYKSLLQSRASKPWKLGVKETEAFFTKNFPTLHNKLERLALLRMLICALIADLKRMGLPITVSTVASNMVMLPLMFETCFPGYIESGLAEVVLFQIRTIKRIRNGKGDKTT